MSSQLPDAPRGSTANRGWQGGEMEMDHQRNKELGFKGESAAVDLDQFRNYVVGEGYQAQHVVRQRGAPKPSNQPLSIQDMTGGAKFSQNDASFSTSDTGERDYLQNAGIREFRKELEGLLK
eukprot:Nitzschia sp. Nitz4//scaffold119_size111653//20941//21306//NITZ4_004179-RA/size111653-processed-gene-0.5-mRNA-1//1//CDS//3329533803//2068//frame0